MFLHKGIDSNRNFELTNMNFQAFYFLPIFHSEIWQAALTAILFRGEMDG